MNPSNDSAAIEAAAATWFARRQGDAWTPTDQSALDAWLDAATAHRIAYLRLAAAWERAGRLAALGAGRQPGVIPPRDAWGLAPDDRPADPPARTPATGWRPRRWTAVAAGLTGLALAWVVWLSSTAHRPEYSTQVGALATVPLSDGSTVTLNTNSRIRVGFTSTVREVTLDRGEAFFEVSKDAARPFVVHIGNRRVTAVGTQFTVRREAGEIRVLVTEGRVQLVRETLLSHSPATPVAAGSEAHTRDDVVLVDHPNPAEVDESLSWRSGYLVFHETPLAEAIAEFNRYNTRRIIIADPTLAGLKIGGRFRFTDSAAFLWLLKNGFPITVAEDDAGIHLTRR